ncbi:MAG: hypothetical protein IJL60_11030 [Clostridiales bacterium]|nr:hypothetical protein [Clostridiales bacterium]
MNNWKRTTTVILIIALSLQAVACGKESKSSKKKSGDLSKLEVNVSVAAKPRKGISGREFKIALEEAGYDVEKSLDKDADECYEAFYQDEDGESYALITYYHFKTVIVAKQCFSDSYDELKALENEDHFNGSISKNDWKFTAEGTFDEESGLGYGDGTYAVGILAENTVLICFSSTDNSGKKALNEALDALGYVG